MPFDRRWSLKMKDQMGAQMRISRGLHGLEDEIDILLSKAGTLLSEVTQFRVEKNLDGNVGHRAIVRLASAQASLVEARTKAIGAHSDLRKIMEERADIPWSCPPSGHLQEVDAA